MPLFFTIKKHLLYFILITSFVIGKLIIPYLFRNWSLVLEDIILNHLSGETTFILIFYFHS